MNDLSRKAFFTCILCVPMQVQVSLQMHQIDHLVSFRLYSKGFFAFVSCKYTNISNGRVWRTIVTIFRRCIHDPDIVSKGKALSSTPTPPPAPDMGDNSRFTVRNSLLTLYEPVPPRLRLANILPERALHHRVRLYRAKRVTLRVIFRQSGFNAFWLVARTIHGPSLLLCFSTFRLPPCYFQRAHSLACVRFLLLSRPKEEGRGKGGNTHPPGRPAARGAKSYL